jgi:cephalosporin hydroxylase
MAWTGSLRPGHGTVVQLSSSPICSATGAGPARCSASTTVPNWIGAAIGDPEIEFITGDSADPGPADQVMAQIPLNGGRIFLILDSDHRAAHVKRELEVWVPRLRPGDYLVVEDTVVNGNPVRPDHGPGPLEAIRQYLAETPRALIRDTVREAKFGATFAVEGYYLKA